MNDDEELDNEIGYMRTVLSGSALVLVIIAVLALTLLPVSCLPEPVPASARHG